MASQYHNKPMMTLFVLADRSENEQRVKEK